jgi:hypothetical protein
MASIIKTIILDTFSLVSYVWATHRKCTTSHKPQACPWEWDTWLATMVVIFYGYIMQPHTIFHILDTYCPPLGSLELDETMPTTCVHDDLVYGVYRWLVRVACARVFHSCMCAQIGRDCIHSSWFDRTIGVHEERDFAWWHKSYL